MVVSTAGRAKGAREARAAAEEVLEAGEVGWVLGVARVKESEGAEETGEAELLVAAVGEVEAVGARGAGDAIKVGDKVKAGDVASAVGLIEYMEAGEVGSPVVALVVIGAAVGVRNSNIAMASVAGILEVIQAGSLP